MLYSLLAEFLALLDEHSLGNQDNFSSQLELKIEPKYSSKIWILTIYEHKHCQHRKALTFTACRPLFINEQINWTG